jgi:hypothetical protein
MELIQFLYQIFGISYKINQYDLNGNLLKTYDKIIIASEETGINRDSISKCINNINKTGAGFIWEKVQ